MPNKGASGGAGIQEVTQNQIREAILTRDSGSEEDEKAEISGQAVQRLLRATKALTHPLWRWADNMDKVLPAKLLPGTLLMLAKGVQPVGHDVLNVCAAASERYCVVLQEDKTDVPMKRPLQVKELASGHDDWINPLRLAPVPRHKVACVKALANAALARLVTFSTGDTVQLSSCYTMVRDAEAGPLKPGQCGVVVNDKEERIMVKCEGDKMWWYDPPALEMSPPEQADEQHSVKAAVASKLEMDTHVVTLEDSDACEDTSVGPIAAGTYGLVMMVDESCIPYKVKDMFTGKEGWYRSTSLRAVPSEVIHKAIAAATRASSTGETAALGRYLAASEVHVGVRVQFRGPKEYYGAAAGDWGTITAVSLPDLFKVAWDNGKFCFVSRDQVSRSTAVAEGARVRALCGYGGVEAGSIGPVYDLATPVIGSRVQVKPGVEAPSLSWGCINSGSFGQVKMLSSDGRLCMVDFPEQRKWVGLVEDLVVQTSHNSS